MPKQWNSTLSASPSWGGKRKASYQSEAEQARIFEQLLMLHRVDWWHVNLPMRSKAGFPDYCLFGDGWLAFAELKAVSVTTGRRGRLSAEQIRYRALIEGSGVEWRMFCLPPDLDEANDWLRAKTGVEVELR